MVAAVEQIKKEIRGLDPEDLEELLRDLQNEYVMPASDEAEQALIDAEWEAEINSRVKDVEEGRVELISGEEADRQTDALFARLGICRPAYRA